MAQLIKANCSILLGMAGEQGASLPGAPGPKGEPGDYGLQGYRWVAVDSTAISLTNS